LLILDPVKLVEYAQTDSNTILIKKNIIGQTSWYCIPFKLWMNKKTEKWIKPRKSKNKITKKTEIL